MKSISVPAYFSQGAGGQDNEAAVSRYSSQYEQRLDPFSAFNQRVSASVICDCTAVIERSCLVHV